jgi:hypothetical protein
MNINDQKIIQRKVWWGLEAKSYTEIAQELPSSDESLRKWIAIYAVYHFNFDNRSLGAVTTTFWRMLKDRGMSQLNLQFQNQLLKSMTASTPIT